MTWRELVNTVRSVLWRQRIDADLEEEIRDHIARETELRQRQGASAAEARRAALAAFGGVERAREGVHDARGITSIDDVWRDVRVVVRRMRRAPRYAALVTITIGLGIGAAASIFSAVDGVLLEPLPYENADRLVTVWQTKRAESRNRDDPAVGNYLDWVARARSFATLAAANPYSVNLRGEDVTETIEAWLVDEGFMEMTGTQPLLGRLFTQQDYEVARSLAQQADTATRLPGVVHDSRHALSAGVLLGYGLWQRRFGGDSSIVGRSVTLDGVAHTVVGVMPPSFALPAPAGVWMPNAWYESQRVDRFGTYLKVFGRLRPGVKVGEANAEMQSIAAALEKEYPRANTGVGATVVRLDDLLLGSHRRLLLVLLGAAGVLALVTIANVAALHVTRLARQRRELSVRAALGARRRDIARPVVLEALALSLLGGGLGGGLAVIGVRVLRVTGPRDLPRLDTIHVDSRVVLAIAALMLASTGVMAALSLRGVRGIGDSLTASGRALIGHLATLRLRRTVVGAQVALGLVLVVATMLLVRSFLLVMSADRGYRIDGILSFTSWVYDEYPTRDGLLAFVEQTRERLAALPGVRSVAVGSMLPLAHEITGETADISLPGSGVLVGEEAQAHGALVTPEYFTTLGIRLRSGRGFDTSDDVRGRPVAVVSASFARRFFPGRDPVGQIVNVGLMGRAVPKEIVGVVSDTRRTRPDAPPEATVYLPFAQRPLPSLTFILATEGDPHGLVKSVGWTMHAINPSVGVARIVTMSDLLDASMQTRRFMLILLGAFAAIAVVVAAVGVYGVVSQSVTEREREIGLRLALGASSGDVVRQFVREAGRMAGWGVVAGLAIAMLSTRAITGFLYGVPPLDPVSLVAASALVAALSLLAAMVPSRRAAKVAPVDVLRDS